MRQSHRALVPCQTPSIRKCLRRPRWCGIGVRWCFHPDASTSIQALGYGVLLDLTGMQEIPRAELDQHSVRVAFCVDSRQVSNIYSEVLCPRVELPVARRPKDDVL